MKILCIDFETANPANASACALGVAVFEGERLVEAAHWLIRPPKEHAYFWPAFIRCHGLRPSDVKDAPEFPAIAPEFFRRLAAADLVIAHNAAFDLRVLKGTLTHFGLECPGFEFLCTLRASRRVWPELPKHGLAAVAAHIGHVFQHHQAQADAEAAGRVLQALIRHTQAKTLAEFAQATRLVFGKVPALSHASSQCL